MWGVSSCVGVSPGRCIGKFLGVNLLCRRQSTHTHTASTRTLHFHSLLLSLKMSMHSKNKFLQSREDQSPNKRLKANISDLLLDGSISGARAASLFTDAQDAQAEGLEDLAGVSQNQNALRDLQRKLTKHSPWPPLYTAKVHMKSLATELVYVDTVNMLLPHEICHQLIHWNQNAGALPYAVEGLTPPARARFLSFCRQFGKDASSTLPLGFWVDGVPVKWDRSESIILFTLNFPGQLHADFKTLRIPLTMINKKFLWRKQ